MIRARAVTSGEVLRYYLSRIDEFNDRLKAFVFVDRDRALDRADEIDRALAGGAKLGPLAGVPIGIKASDPVEGMPNAYPDIFSSSIARADSPHVQRLRAAAAIIVGKTAVPEYQRTAQYYTTSRAFGITRNPWNPSRTSGGSSGGSASAVAAGMIPMATGIDGGGSVRLPASYCGLVGFKPSHGAVPNLDSRSFRITRGVLASCVVDAELWFGSVSEAPARTEARRFPLRVAYSSTLEYGSCEESIEAVVRDAVSRLESHGLIQLVQTEVPLLDPHAAWTTFAAVDRGIDVDPAERAEADMVKKVNDARLDLLFSRVELILSPTSATRVPLADGLHPVSRDLIYGPLLTWAFNISGHPAISIPCGWGDDGLPVGLQVVAERQRDAALLEAARRLEEAIEFADLGRIDR